VVGFNRLTGLVLSVVESFVLVGWDVLPERRSGMTALLAVQNAVKSWFAPDFLGSEALSGERSPRVVVLRGEIAGAFGSDLVTGCVWARPFCHDLDHLKI
jgi:hypothetical protein